MSEDPALTRAPTRDAAEAAAKRGDPQPLFDLAADMLSRRDPAAAGVLAALERHPGHAPGWQAVGAALLRMGQAEAALVAYDRAGGSAEAALGRAACHEAAGRPGAAADALAEVAPLTAELAYRRGLLLRRAGRLAEAREALAGALAGDPGHAKAQFALGLACQDAGAPEDAARAYRAALAIRPDYHEAALNLGTALQATGAWEAALDAYALALRLNRNSFGRIAQALSAAPVGRLWLSPAALRAALEARAA